MPPTRRLTSDDVGARVVVRYRLADGRATDVLGELIAFDEAQLAVRDRHGAEHRIEQCSIVAAKTVPPAPPRR